MFRSKNYLTDFQFHCKFDEKRPYVMVCTIIIDHFEGPWHIGARWPPRVYSVYSWADPAITHIYNLIGDIFRTRLLLLVHLYACFCIEILRFNYNTFQKKKKRKHHWSLLEGTVPVKVNGCTTPPMQIDSFKHSGRTN